MSQLASASSTSEELKRWPRLDKRRLLHIVYRVVDLEKTMDFYVKCLGMTLLRKRDCPDEKYTNAFLGYGAEDSHCVIELTLNYGWDKYQIGTGFGHVGIAVPNVSFLFVTFSHLQCLCI